MKNKSPSFFTFILGLALIVTCILYIIIPKYWQHVPEEVKHLLLVIIAMVALGLVERSFLLHRFEKWAVSIIDEIRSNYEEVRSNNQIIAEALSQINKGANCGVSKLYCCRKEKEVLEDVNAAIGKSKRVWLLGVAFSEHVKLSNLVDLLHKKALDGNDVKMLLLDPLRSPSLFRSFLESPPDVVKETLDAELSGGTTHHPFFHHRLYTDFLSVYETLRKYPAFDKAVRFYAHSPACWLVILDDVAFFQPYTFGKSLEHRQTSHDNFCIGAHMPIFLFEKCGNKQPFQIVENHFHKLWCTSDIDLFHIGIRIQDKIKILRHIFKTRRPWFENIYEMVRQDYKNQQQPPMDRRLYPRQRCKSVPPMHISWNGRGLQRTASVKNFSKFGLALESKSKPDIAIDGQLTLQRPNVADVASNFIVENLLERNAFEFTVKGVESIKTHRINLEHRFLIRLQATNQITC